MYKVLVFTDHTKHSVENSLYALLNEMQKHPLCQKINVVSKGIDKNNDFFNGESTLLFSTEINNDFVYTKDGFFFSNDLKKTNIDEFDLIWLRLPPPLSKVFLNFLSTIFSSKVIINNPNGILKAGSKEFLLNFSEVCPPMKICKSLEDIIAFKNQFPIVLKPLRGYGGKGILKIENNLVSEGTKTMPFETFIQNFSSEKLPYLGVKFLKNVQQGDKRIIVINGEIIGASLRLPKANSWLCNASMGGSSHLAKIEKEEEQIVATIHPTLSALGIVIYGIDTLVNDNGKRILSEINTTSIGGIKQIEQLTKRPIIKRSIELIWAYFLKNNKRNVCI